MLLASGIMLTLPPHPPHPSRMRPPALRQILNPGALQLCAATSYFVWLCRTYMATSCIACLCKALCACAEFLFSASSVHPVPYFPFFLSRRPQAPFRSLSNNLSFAFVVLCLIPHRRRRRKTIATQKPSLPPFFSFLLSLVLSHGGPGFEPRTL